MPLSRSSLHISDKPRVMHTQGVQTHWHRGEAQQQQQQQHVHTTDSRVLMRNRVFLTPLSECGAEATKIRAGRYIYKVMRVDAAAAAAQCTHVMKQH